VRAAPAAGLGAVVPGLQASARPARPAAPAARAPLRPPPAPLTPPPFSTPPPLASLAAGHAAPGAPALDTWSDEELDLLPYGALCLDGAGTVLRYNLAESRLARLDRQQVLGRNFFRDVAPCTATPHFEGRFRALLATPAATASRHPVVFDYLFDFKFGAQAVRVELVRGEAGRVWVLVNRTRFYPPRAEVPERLKAPLQAELAPGESALGVLRDALERREVHLTPAFFHALRTTWERVAPRSWPLFAFEWGFRWGRTAVVDLELDALELTGMGLKELPLRSVVELASRALRQQGWGQLVADWGASRRDVFLVHVERSALAEAAPRTSTEPCCQLLAGFLRAVFCHLAQKLLVVREVGCRASGHPRCSFVLVGPTRREELEAALRLAHGEVSTVLALLDTRRAH
jgi:photoactive yellow protein